MPLPVLAYRVLIASPSDVQKERAVIEKAIHEWNSINTIKSEKVLIPVMWETDSVPLQGDRPQGILNEMMVKDCDLLIAVFWTKLGSYTGKESSGTVEEIKFFIKQKRPALIYYSKTPLPQNHDPEQWDALKNFKKSISTGGIQEPFDGEAELSMKVLRHLTTVLDNMQMAPTVAAKDVRKLIRDGDKSANKEPFVINNTSQLSSEITLKKKTEKSFIVCGLIDENHQWPARCSGQYISLANGEKAWQFSNKRLELIAKHLGVPAEIGF